MAKRAKTAKAPKRKVGKKKAPTRKKAPVRKKKTTRKKPRVRKKPPAKKAPTRKSEELSVQIDVWTAYERTRSILATARETQHAEHVVREVLKGDHGRQLVILDDFIEACVAEWEQKQIRAHGIMDELLTVFQNLLIEIGLAAKEERPTKIISANGAPMAVPDALQLLVVSKMLDQVHKLATTAQGISTDYRQRGPGASTDPKGAADAEDPDDFDRWTDANLADAIRAGGLRVPKAIERKIALMLPAGS